MDLLLKELWKTQSPKRVSFNNNVNTLERIMGTNILPPETFAVTTQLQLKHCLLEL